MTGIRRALTLIGLTVAVIVGASLPASATFADSSAVAHTVSTGTVAAPTRVTIDDYCSTTLSLLPVPTVNYWYNATVTWSAGSAPRGVTGYLVVAHLNNGQSLAMAQTDAATRRVNATVDRGYLAYQPRISVITLTSYGWTAASAQTAVLSC